MPNPSPIPTPSTLPVAAQRNDAKLVIYTTQEMRVELEARVDATADSSMSRVVRQALREFFRRHPRTGKT